MIGALQIVFVQGCATAMSKYDRTRGSVAEQVQATKYQAKLQQNFVVFLAGCLSLKRPPCT